MAELINTSSGQNTAGDRRMAERLKAWLHTKDPRPSHGAIVLADYEDGFSIQYLGPDPIDRDELVRRVVYIGDQLRQAAGPLDFYR